MKQPFGAPSSRPTVAGRDHAITTGHYLATVAAMRVLDDGGNAIDAGVTAALALAVLQPDIVCFAGVAPTLVYMADEERLVSLAGLGHWPRATDIREMRRHGDGVTVPEGLLRSVVPAAPATHIEALRRFGTISFEQAAGAALDIAKRGFYAYPSFVYNVQHAARKYSRWESNRNVFLPGGQPPKVGQLFVQLELAHTIEQLIVAEREARGDRDKKLAAVHDYFYRGPIAQRISDYHIENGGFLRYDDLRSFSVPAEEAISTRFKSYDVYSCDVWCQGVSMLEMLNILAGYELGALEHNSCAYIHLVTEAMNLAFADREAYLGDPRFSAVPTEMLLSEQFAAHRRKQINPQKAFGQMPSAGMVGGATGERVTAHQKISSGPKATADPDTIYSGVIDKRGNIYSATLSDNSADSPLIPGTGLAISSRGMQSRLDPSHPAFAQPGARPRLTPAPMIVAHAGRPVMCMGSPGGDVQIQAMLQVLIAVTEFNMPLQVAVENPRFCTSNFPNSFAPHEYFPGRLSLETGISQEVAAQLAKLGHDVEIWPARSAQAGAVCVAARRPETGAVAACADPRREAYALAW